MTELREKMNEKPGHRWLSRKLWAIVAFAAATFVLQWYAKVDPGTWQYLALPMLGYLVGQSWVDGKASEKG